MPSPAEQTAIDLIAAKLPRALQHPGDPDTNQPARILPMLGLSNTAIPPEMAKAFADQAGLPANDTPRLYAEAIIHTLTLAGYTITTQADLDELHTAATAITDQPGTPIKVFTRCNATNPLLELDIRHPNANVDCTLIAKQLANVCRCP